MHALYRFCFLPNSFSVAAATQTTFDSMCTEMSASEIVSKRPYVRTNAKQTEETLCTMRETAPLSQFCQVTETPKGRLYTLSCTAKIEM
jgi:hypothetical protein